MKKFRIYDQRNKGELLPHFDLVYRDLDDASGNVYGLRLSFCSLARLTLAKLDVDDDHVRATLALYGPYVALSVEPPVRVMRKLRALLRIPGYEPRTLGVHFHDLAVWWDVWANSHHWTSDTPRWRDGSWHPLNTFFGRENYESTLVEKADVIVPMPEKGYAGTVEIRRDTWKRPRSPFTRVVHRAHVEMKEPIPVPGKGENSWDCGEDAIHGITTPAKSIVEGIVAIMNSAKRDREKRAGKNWKPEERAAS